MHRGLKIIENTGVTLLLVRKWSLFDEIRHQNFHSDDYRTQQERVVSFISAESGLHFQILFDATLGLYCSRT